MQVVQTVSYSRIAFETFNRLERVSPFRVFFAQVALVNVFGSLEGRVLAPLTVRVVEGLIQVYLAEVLSDIMVCVL